VFLLACAYVSSSLVSKVRCATSLETMNHRGTHPSQLVTLSVVRKQLSRSFGHACTTSTAPLGLIGPLAAAPWLAENFTLWVSFYLLWEWDGLRAEGMEQCCRSKTPCL
jgi:hypothetical protein